MSQPVRVINVGVSPVDLSDGRILAPGDAPVEVKVLTEHERQLLASGVLARAAKA